MDKRNDFTLGLDIGTNSIGWAVIGCDDALEQIGLIGCGARIFQEAVDVKTKTPKTKPVVPPALRAGSLAGVKCGAIKFSIFYCKTSCCRKTPLNGENYSPIINYTIRMNSEGAPWMTSLSLTNSAACYIT